MSAILCSPATTAVARRFSLLRWIGRSRPFPRLDLAALPDDLRRDLGFLDGRSGPPRDPLRD